MTQQNTPITAARFAIVCDGCTVASFSEMQGIKTEVKTTEFIESGENGLVQTNVPANPVLAVLSFKRAQTSDMQLWLWHETVRKGEMGAAARSCSLVMFDVANKPVARYHLFGAWPSKMELAPLRAGSSDVLMETVTIVCDHLQRVAP